VNPPPAFEPLTVERAFCVRLNYDQLFKVVPGHAHRSARRRRVDALEEPAALDHGVADEFLAAARHP